MRFIPSDTVDHANLNRTFQRPSSPHEERSFFIVRLLTERAYFRFGKLLCRPGCVFTLGVVMQDQHRQPCTIAGPYVSQHFLVAVRISKCRARQPRDLTRAAALGAERTFVTLRSPRVSGARPQSLRSTSFSLMYQRVVAEAAFQRAVLVAVMNDGSRAASLTLLRFLRWLVFVFRSGPLWVKQVQNLTSARPCLTWPSSLLSARMRTPRDRSMARRNGGRPASVRRGDRQPCRTGSPSPDDA